MTFESRNSKDMAPPSRLVSSDLVPNFDAQNAIEISTRQGLDGDVLRRDIRPNRRDEGVSLVLECRKGFFILSCIN